MSGNPLTQHRHAMAVAAPRDLFDGPGPLLLDRDDADFVDSVLAELGSAAGRQRLLGTKAAERDGNQTLKLFQPIQRRFHIALIEAWCETAGTPRIDPTRVDKAGLVVRRLRQRDGRSVREGWMRAAGELRGWVEIDRLGGEQVDPAPQTRLAARDTGVAQIDRALRRLDADSDAALLEEQVVPMFVAPPEVCSAVGRTLYYGVVPTASSELAQTEPDTDALFEGFEADSNAFRSHLVQPLRGQAWNLPAPPAANRRFTGAWLTDLESPSASTNQKYLLQLLRQVVVEFDAFGDSDAAQRLHQALAAIQLKYALKDDEETPRTVNAASFIAAASRVLLEGEGGSVEMPESWPALSPDGSRALASAMSAAMRQRFIDVKGRPGRFDEPDARYQVRAFVRLKAEGKCPATTIWGDYSEPFVIAPWYESAADPVQIALPNLSDRNVLKAMKPNVAFTLPKELQSLLSASPTDLLEGKDDSKTGFDIGWICSFSIPVITFCAFIVLNIFLSLFNIIFRWMLFIKICIPYPKAK